MDVVMECRIRDVLGEFLRRISPKKSWVVANKGTLWFEIEINGK